VQQAGPLEVKADAQLGARQRGVAEPAARACGVARKSSDSRLEKQTTLLTNTEEMSEAIPSENFISLLKPTVVSNKMPVTDDMGRMLSILIFVKSFVLGRDCHLNTLQS